MSPEKIINKQARELLRKDNLPAAVGVTAVLGFTIMGCDYLSAFLIEAAAIIMEKFGIYILYDSVFLFYTVYAALTLGGIILSLPIFLGAVRFYHMLAINSEASFSEVFYFLKEARYFPTIGKLLYVILKHLWQGIVSFLPGVLTLITAAAEAADKAQLDFYNVLWYVIGYAMIIGGIVLFCFLTADKFMALYLLADNEDTHTLTAVTYSQVLMIRFEKSVPRIMLRYLPLLACCILIIPALFIVPYIMTSYAISAKWIRKTPTKHKDE